MSTQTAEKKVLFFNEKAFQKQKAEVEAYINSINEFGALLSDFDLKLTPEFLTEFMEKGHPLISDKAVEVFLTSDNGSRFLVDHVRTNANREASKFRNYNKNFSDHVIKNRIPISDVPIKDGRAYLSPEMEKNLKDQNTIILDPARKSQFDIIQQFADNFNAFARYCIEHNMNAPQEELMEVFSDSFYIMDELLESGFYIIPDKNGEKIQPNPYYFK